MQGISRSRLSTKVLGLSENMEGPKNCILMQVFLVGTSMVSAVGKFRILAFLEALKNLMISKKAFLLCQKVGAWLLCPFPYTDPVYLFTVSLFYLYSCANLIVKLISKAEALASMQN